SAARLDGDLNTSPKVRGVRTEISKVLREPRVSRQGKRAHAVPGSIEFRVYAWGNRESSSWMPTKYRPSRRSLIRYSMYTTTGARCPNLAYVARWCWSSFL